MKWQAPPADFLTVNPVRFYAMGVESNNDDTSMGDYVYTATRLIVVEPKKAKKDKRSTLLTRARNTKRVAQASCLLKQSRAGGGHVGCT